MRCPVVRRPARRRLLRLALPALATALPPLLHAQPYPARPLRLVVPFPPAGATDIIARELARHVGERLKQQIIVDNRPGAGGALGSEIVAKSAADGHTIQMATTSTHAVGPLLSAKPAYDPRADFTPVAHVANAANVPLVAPNVPAKNVREFIELLKRAPGRYNYGSSGNGTIVHLTSELFKAMTGTYVVHIPYRGTALVIPDMVAGQIHLLFDSIASALPHIRDGKLRALGVTSRERSPLLPEVPAVSETVPGFESVTWFGILGPRGLPADVVARLNSDINAVLKTPEFVDRARALGFEPAGGSPQEFAALLVRDTDKWAKLIRERRITAE